MATAPSAVTAIWVDVTTSSLAHLRARGSASSLWGGFDPHGVERAPHERQRDDEERPREHQAQGGPASGGQRDRQLDREQAKQRREFDDRVHRDRRRILEWVANGVADDGGVVQRRAFLLQLGLHDLLGVVP